MVIKAYEKNTNSVNNEPNWNKFNFNQKIKYISNNCLITKEEIKYLENLSNKISKNNKYIKYFYISGGIIAGALTTGLSSALSAFLFSTSFIGVCKSAEEFFDESELEYTLNLIYNNKKNQIINK